MNAAVPLALYVHMPWCVRKCPYCDFNSHQLKSASPPVHYIDALIKDFDSELPEFEGRRIDTVFFGGGTPSLFRPDEFARLLEALGQRAAFAGDAEITLEANPGTVERGRFAGYRDAGINRVSLGAQSFDPRALERLGRIHTAEDTHRAVEELRSAGIDNFNLDLMYALPGQGLDEAIADVRAACALRPAHISYYQLTLEPGTVFHARPPTLPGEDEAWTIQTECQQILAAEGFEQYEVSAYAQRGARCRHNLNYWLFGDYVGLGAGAHGKISSSLPDGILRTAKPNQPREYLGRLDDSPIAPGPTATGCPAPIGERKYIAAADLPFEFMLNALRLNEGFATRDFECRTGLPLSSVEAALRRAGNRGLVEGAGGRWRPTAIGARFLNDLQASFLA
ncbi:MAG: radical SAM family heme chaperone HemW [Steroidobacteraceae bacterium]